MDSNDNSVSSLLTVLLQDQEYLDDHKNFLEQCYGTELPVQGKDEQNTDGHFKQSEMLRRVAQLSNLPRLIHMKTTAETVNAVEALILAGEVDESSCCALIDREEGVRSLEQSLKHRQGFEETEAKFWVNRGSEERATNDDEKEYDQSGHCGMILTEHLPRFREW